MGLETDLRLVGNDYQWLGSMFYFGRSYALLADAIPSPSYKLY